MYSLPLLYFILQRRDKSMRKKIICNKATQAAMAVLRLPRSQGKMMFNVTNISTNVSLLTSTVAEMARKARYRPCSIQKNHKVISQLIKDAGMSLLCWLYVLELSGSTSLHGTSTCC